jgi:hypothetical protein
MILMILEVEVGKWARCARHMMLGLRIMATTLEALHRTLPIHHHLVAPFFVKSTRSARLLHSHTPIAT